MKHNPLVYLPLLERALEAEVGLFVETNLPRLLRDQLYQTKKSAPNPSLFDDIITFLPEGKNVVFICKKGVELPE